METEIVHGRHASGRKLEQVDRCQLIARRGGEMLRSGYSDLRNCPACARLIPRAKHLHSSPLNLNEIAAIPRLDGV